MTHKELVAIAYRWAMNSAGCSFAFREFVSASWEIPDVLAFKGAFYTILIECKASRSDFLADRKKPFRANPALGMGTHRIYCCPAGLIKLEELPEGWALLSVSPSGRCRLTHRPKSKARADKYLSDRYAMERGEHHERAIMYSALRRIHIRGLLETIYEKHARE